MNRRSRIVAVSMVFAAACAGLVATGIGQAEQPASGTPVSLAPAEIKASFGVFRQSATSADALPETFSAWVKSAEGDPALRDLNVEEARLASDNGEEKLFLAPRGTDGICMIAFAAGGLAGLDCASVRSAADPATPMSSGAKYINMVIPDAVHGVRATSRDGGDLGVARGHNVAVIDNSSDQGVRAITLVGSDGAPVAASSTASTP